MDGERFDAMTRSWAASAARRGALRLLAAGALGAILARPRGVAAQVGIAANTGSCRATGDVCDGDKDCCSERCEGGRCQCRRRGAACAVDRACCSGRCRKRKGRCA